MLVPLIVLACTQPNDSPPDGPGSETGSETEVPCHAPPAIGAPTGQQPPVLPAPTWQAHGPYDVFSSPRLADLDGDGVLDVISGHGTDTGESELHTVGYATAHSGATGTELWRIDARQDLFTTAALPDLDGDGIADPVFGGRHAELLAVSGATGSALWTFSMDVEEARAAGWYNTYSAQPIPDRDGDGVADLLIANGGDSLIVPEDPVRPSGRLALVSGATGAVLGFALVPDRQETYLSPVLLDGDVIFGTGGETVAGSLWRTSLDDIGSGDIDGALELLPGELGAIAPPSLADLNGDCVDDIVTAHFSGTIAAIDGASHEVMWRVDHPGQTYNSPTLGFFTGDGHPDVFASVREGTWPLFDRMVHFLIDGATGEILWTDELGVFGSSGGLAVDLDGDGRDEVLVGVNAAALADVGQNGGGLYHLDPITLDLTPMADLDRPGVSNPWIGDLDGDTFLELVTSVSDLSGADRAWRTERYDLDVQGPPRVSWGGYLGTAGDGHLTF